MSEIFPIPGHETWRIVLGYYFDGGPRMSTHYYLRLEEFRPERSRERRWRKPIVLPAGWVVVHELDFDAYWRYPSERELQIKVRELKTWFELYLKTKETS